MAGREKEITRKLKEWRQGKESALCDILPDIESELRKLAISSMRGEKANHTLQTTALINEVFLRLLKDRQTVWKDRTHFFAVAALITRHILIDCARKARSSKHGGASVVIPINEERDGRPPSSVEYVEVIALYEALDRLAEKHPTAAKVVELKFITGLNHEEIAEALHLSVSTVKREWAYAKARLRRELG
jgi:RNA polymerase sigma-70 factor (ECF subfamily)